MDTSNHDDGYESCTDSEEEEEEEMMFLVFPTLYCISSTKMAFFLLGHEKTSFLNQYECST